MSAFVVSDSQISVVVNVWADAVAILKSSESGVTDAGLGLSRCQEVANILLRENVRSVNYRYNEKSRAGKVKFTRRVLYPMVPALQAIKYLECIDYQSCERPDYNKSDACAINRAMRLDLFRLYVGGTQIDRMKWSLD